jgi:ribosomal protein S1
LITIIAGLVAAGLGFFGGMKYQESKTPRFARNLPENFQEMREEFGQRSDGVAVGLRPVNGEVLSVDEDSITVKLPDDSSKIILLSENSVINKTEEGSKDDLGEGTEIVVFGQENSDGSITAQNIQIGTGLFGRR